MAKEAGALCILVYPRAVLFPKEQKGRLRRSYWDLGEVKRGTRTNRPSPERLGSSEAERQAL